MANSVYFEATLIDLGQPQKLIGYWLLQDFEATSIDFETTSIDWRLAQLSRQLFEAFYWNLLQKRVIESV